MCDAKDCMNSLCGVRGLGAELTGSPPTFDCRQSNKSLSLTFPSANPKMVVSPPAKVEVDATLLVSSSSSEAVATSYPPVRPK